MIGTIRVLMDDDKYLYILDYAKLGQPSQSRHEMLCRLVVPHVKRLSRGALGLLYIWEPEGSFYTYFITLVLSLYAMVR